MKVFIGRYPGRRSKATERIVRVRIDRSDTWNMDHTLALIVHPMLVQLKATKHGAPKVDDADVPEELRSTSAPPLENEWDTDENYFKRWDWVLDEMIFAFEASARGDWEDQYFTGVHDTQFVETELNGRKVYEMVKGPDDTSRFDAEGHRAHSDRITQGIVLFGKYYRGLWD